MGDSQRKIIVFNITPRCNLDCAFCFGPRLGEKEPTEEEAKTIIKKAATGGVEKIVFTGGEPLLRDDIFILIKQAKKLGLITALHTNGLLFSKDILDKLRGHLDQINLPLDGHDEPTNDLRRTEGHFQKVIEALKLLNREEIKVVVSSVITLQNKEDLVKVGGTLRTLVTKNQARIDLWRVFQFNPQGKAAKVKRELYLKETDFTEVTNKITLLEYPFEVQCIANSDKEFYKSYYLI